MYDELVVSTKHLRQFQRGLSSHFFHRVRVRPHSTSRLSPAHKCRLAKSGYSDGLSAAEIGCKWPVDDGASMPVKQKALRVIHLSTR